ncbi:hypothetical protein HK405_003013 [Cladochytrium tenue]|nr:hypothetical protein HK405_003013 [Cladochytrium tenue]
MYSIHKRLFAAGRTGWKAFAVFLYCCIDPEGRLDVLERFQLPGHQYLLPGVSPTSHEFQQRIADAALAAKQGWKPAAESTIPYFVLEDVDGDRVTTTYKTILLTPNIDLAPGFLVITRLHDLWGQDLNLTSIGWQSFLRHTGAHFEHVESAYEDEWTAAMWNEFFRMIFVCHGGSCVVDFEKLRGLLWKSFENPRP